MWNENSNVYMYKQTKVLSLKYELQKILQCSSNNKCTEDLPFDDINKFYNVIISFCDGNYNERMEDLSSIDVFNIYYKTSQVKKISQIRKQAEEEYSYLEKIKKTKNISEADDSKLKKIINKLLSALDNDWNESLNENEFNSWGY